MSVALKAIAWLELWGGASGAYLVASGWRSGHSRILLVAFAVFFGLSLVAGWLLTRGHRAGPFLSLGVQAFQVLAVSTTPIRYRIYSGACLFLGFGDGGNLLFDAALASGADVQVPNPASHWVFVNVIAIAAILALGRVVGTGAQLKGN